jgi:hypothetical protein
LPIVAVDTRGHLISLPPLADIDASVTTAPRKTRTVVRRGGALIRTSAVAATAGDKLPTVTAGLSSNHSIHQQQQQSWPTAADRPPVAPTASVSSDSADLDQTIVSHWRLGAVDATAGGGHHQFQQRKAATNGISLTERVRYDLPARPPRHRVAASAVATTTSGQVGNGKQADISCDVTKTASTMSSQVRNRFSARL